MVDILGIYTEYLREKNSTHKEKYVDYEGWFSASTAGSCFKKQLLRKENTEEKPFDDRVLRLLRLGTIVHQDIQKSVTDSIVSSDINYKIYMEHIITLPELKVVGHLDVGVMKMKTEYGNQSPLVPDSPGVTRLRNSIFVTDPKTLDKNHEPIRQQYTYGQIEVSYVNGNKSVNLDNFFLIFSISLPFFPITKPGLEV